MRAILVEIVLKINLVSILPRQTPLKPRKHIHFSHFPLTMTCHRRHVSILFFSCLIQTVLNYSLLAEYAWPNIQMFRRHYTLTTYLDWICLFIFFECNPVVFRLYAQVASWSDTKSIKKQHLEQVASDTFMHRGCCYLRSNFFIPLCSYSTSRRMRLHLRLVNIGAFYRFNEWKRWHNSRTFYRGK